MTNSYPSGSPGVPDSSMPTGAPGFMPRRSSYASVLSGTASGVSQPFQQPSRSGAFSHLLSQQTDFSYDSTYPNFSGHSRYDNRGYDMDYTPNGGGHGRSGSWGRGGQLPSFSSAFGLLMNGQGNGGFGGAHTDQFFIPSYLRGSKYVQKLEEAHKAKLTAHKEGHSVHSSQPGSLSTSDSSINLHAKMAPSHRGMTYDLIEKAPPLENENLAPLPSKWNNEDKFPILEVLSDGQEVKLTGPKPERNQEHEAYAIRADHPMPPQCGIYYFEVTIITRKREQSSIGIGFSGKNVELKRMPGWEPESWAYHGDDGHSFCCQTSGKSYGPPFTAGDVIGCGVNFRTGAAFFTKNGDHLGTAFRELKGKLYPSVGMKTAGEHVRVNFGQSPFIFDIDGMMSASNHNFFCSHSFIPQSPALDTTASNDNLALGGASESPMASAPTGLPTTNHMSWPGEVHLTPENQLSSGRPSSQSISSVNSNGSMNSGSSWSLVSTSPLRSPRPQDEQAFPPDVLPDIREEVQLATDALVVHNDHNVEWAVVAGPRLEIGDASSGTETEQRRSHIIVLRTSSGVSANRRRPIDGDLQNIVLSPNPPTVPQLLSQSFSAEPSNSPAEAPSTRAQSRSLEESQQALIDVIEADSMNEIAGISQFRNYPDILTAALIRSLQTSGVFGRAVARDILATARDQIVREIESRFNQSTLHPGLPTLQDDEIVRSVQRRILAEVAPTSGYSQDIQTNPSESSESRISQGFIPALNTSRRGTQTLASQGLGDVLNNTNRSTHTPAAAQTLSVLNNTDRNTQTPRAEIIVPVSDNESHRTYAQSTEDPSPIRHISLVRVAGAGGPSTHRAMVNVVGTRAPALSQITPARQPRGRISGESAFSRTWTNFLLQQEKKHIRQEIESTSTAKLAPPLNETDLIQSLVLQFLTHDGYVETAQAFAQEVHAEKRALSLDPNTEVNGFEVKEDEDAGHRQRIRAAVLEGDVDKALKFTNAFYPHVLKDNEHVYFRLRCLKFIEMIRQGGERHKANSTNGVKSNGHSGDWYDDMVNQQMDVDDQPTQNHNWDRMDTEESSGQQNESDGETLAYGQGLQAEFQNDPRREVHKALTEAFALMAYVDLSSAPREIAYQLDPSGRVSVAEELNSAILLSLGKSSSAALEQLYQQTSVLLEDLREGGGPGAFVNIDDFARPKLGLMVFT